MTRGVFGASTVTVGKVLRGVGWLGEEEEEEGPWDCVEDKAEEEEEEEKTGRGAGAGAG